MIQMVRWQFVENQSGLERPSGDVGGINSMICYHFQTCGIVSSAVFDPERFATSVSCLHKDVSNPSFRISHRRVAD
jgi:hypothetical protein